MTFFIVSFLLMTREIYWIKKSETEKHRKSTIPFPQKKLRKVSDKADSVLFFKSEETG